MKMKKLFAVILSAGLISAVFAGCAPADEQTNAGGGTPDGSAAISGKLQLVGSTSVDPLAQKLAAEYKKQNGSIDIGIQAVGSGAGIEATVNGTAGIGMSSRDLTAAEKAKGIQETVIAKDGIAVAVNPANKVSGLTSEQIRKIFMGEISNWSEIGGDDQEIIVVSREDGSGTRSAFEELLKVETEKDGKKASGLRKDANIAEGNGAVQSNIGTKTNAIGYVSLGHVNDSIKPLEVDGVKATTENVLNGTYPVSRPFLFLTKGTPEATAKAFIDFVLSEQGQAIVEAEKYIKVN